MYPIQKWFIGRRSVAQLAGLLVMASGMTGFAQNPAAPSPGTEKVHALIPQEAVACLTVRLQQIQTDQALRLLPWELISAASLEGVGIDIGDIERFDLFVGPVAQMPGIAGVITSKSKLDLSQLSAETFKPIEVGKSYEIVGIPDFRNVQITSLGVNQAVIGHQELVPIFLQAKRGPGELQQQLKRLGESGHISLTFVPGPVRPMLMQGVESLSPELIEDTRVLAEKVQLVAARAQVDANPVINVLIQTNTEQEAQAVEASWNKIAQFVSQQSMRQMFTGNVSEEMIPSLQSYAKRVHNEIVALLKPTRKGNRLLLTIDQRFINLARGLSAFASLGPARFGMRGRGGGPRGGQIVGVTDMDKLKQIALAAHNFESAIKRLPMDGEISPRMLHKHFSWRVNILPYIEHAALYNEFKQDEPWDSPHNIRLLEKMPDIYRYSKAQVEPGFTVVQMPKGPGLISEEGKQIKFADITDGLSNTVLLAVSTDAAAVPWTKPDDFNPLEDLEMIRSENGKVTLVLADGRALDLPVPPGDGLKAILTRAGGERVQLP